MTRSLGRLPRLHLAPFLALVAGVIAIATVARGATAAPDLRGRVDDVITPLMSAQAIPGMAIGLVAGDETFVFYYGVASRESNAPVNERTLFEVGSVSKTFTATLAALAEAEGRIAFTDHPSRFLPQLKGTALDQAQLLHLGTYTVDGFTMQMPEEIITEEQLFTYLKAWQSDTAPGSRRRYANVSIGLLGRVSAIALGTDYATAMGTRVIAPLGLSHTYIHVPDHALPDYAWGYNKAEKPVRVNPGVLDVEAYGIKTTAKDLLRYLQHQIDPSGLPDPLQQAIARTHVGYFKVGEMVQGLGWEQYSYPVSVERLLAGNSQGIIFESNPVEKLDPNAAPSGARLYNKTGGTGGFSAYVMFVPERRLGVVLLANKNYPIAARVRAGHALLELLAGKTPTGSQP